MTISAAVRLGKERDGGLWLGELVKANWLAIQGGEYAGVQSIQTFK